LWRGRREDSRTDWKWRRKGKRGGQHGNKEWIWEYNEDIDTLDLDIVMVGKWRT